MAGGRGAGERRPIPVVTIMECVIGGTRRHLDQLATHCDLGRFALTVVLSARREPAVREQMGRWRARGVRAVELPMRREIAPCADGAHLARIAGLLRRVRPAVVHTHSSKAGVLGRLACRLLRPRPAVVHTPHTFAFAFDREFSPWRRRAFLGIERWLGASTDVLVAVSPSEAAQGRELRIVPAERIRIVENGLDEEAWKDLPSRGKARERWGIPARVRLVVTAGLLSPAKSQADLLEAAARLLPRHPDLHLVIAGRGPLLEDLQRRARDLGLEDRVAFPGFTDDMKGLYRAADVFVLPSRWEGMPYVILEAMAAGCPVIATDVNGSRDLIRDGETGRLVPAGDAPALAEALDGWLSAPARARAMAERARAVVRARPGAAGSVARLEEIWEALAREKGRG